jgi:hypothetical protein
VNVVASDPIEASGDERPQGRPLVPVFGVRHFSPAGALHVRTFLDEHDPAVVLIEGPADATPQLLHLLHPKTAPPVAILAFTKTRPVRSLVYPLAAYSPEFVAARWALEHKREVRFIDLPASVFLALRAPDETSPDEAEAPTDEPIGRDSEAKPGEDDREAEPLTESPDRSRAYLDDPYEAIARLAGEPDHDTWWERHFEHTREASAYRDAALELGRGLRDLRSERAESQRAHETALREAYMCREIRRALAELGQAKGKHRGAVVVCGAFHAPVLNEHDHAMTDAELAALPRADSVLTLMPYSYLRLSPQSGYGAGNHAPSYFEAVFDEASRGTPERVGARYLSSLARALRRGGILRSSAEVIEAVRLAEGLAALNGSAVPALRDLRDAAQTLLGHGERLPIEEALRAVEIGTAVGRLPPGVSRTALQDDFHALLKLLKLDQFLEDKDQRLELDLREDRTKKSRDAAFLDRRRSTFLHRLAVLDIGFCRVASREQRGTAKEAWLLRWTPECEIRLAERSLGADSIESGAAFALATELSAAADTGAATRILLRAMSCELADALSLATRRVQELTVDEAGFQSAAEGLENLSHVLRYGTVRDLDPAPLRPIFKQIYLRATLLLFAASVCSDDATKGLRLAMDRVHEAAFLDDEALELTPAPWLEAVERVAHADDRNAFLSGYATALLIERGILDDEAIDRAVSRRLSPGTHADVGVGYFEGLVQRNRTALFMRLALWRSLSDYVDALDDDGFRRALLYLRRAFASFSQGEIRRVVSLLGELWQGAGIETLAADVEKKLDEQEIDDLVDDLGDLDL